VESKVKPAGQTATISYISNYNEYYYLGYMCILGHGTGVVVVVVVVVVVLVVVVSPYFLTSAFCYIS